MGIAWGPPFVPAVAGTGSAWKGKTVSDDKQRAQWIEHLKDEARAREAQQAGAGRMHSPMEGPLPYSSADLEQAIRAAVHAERERCAKAVEAWASAEHLRATFGALDHTQVQAVQQVLQALGAEIQRP
jgi:hypothetical protein